MLIANASRTLRSDLFRAQPRERTKGIYTTYLDTPFDPRVDAFEVDALHCKYGRISSGVHFVVRTDGVVEIARHPLTATSFGPQKFHHTHFVLGVVGGRDHDTGKRSYTLNEAQRRGLECLYQALADAMGVPLEIEEWVEKEDKELAEEEHRQAALETEMQAREELEAKLSPID